MFLSAMKKSPIALYQTYSTIMCATTYFDTICVQFDQNACNKLTDKLKFV